MYIFASQRSAAQSSALQQHARLAVRACCASSTGFLIRRNSVTPPHRPSLVITDASSS
jgi:hypothetical protein